jgi:hypothetical protein
MYHDTRWLNTTDSEIGNNTRIHDVSEGKLIELHWAW